MSVPGDSFAEGIVRRYISFHLRNEQQMKTVENFEFKILAVSGSECAPHYDIN